MPTVTASIMLSEKKKKESFSCPRPYWLCTSKSWCWCIYFVSSFAISYSAACFLENKAETFRCCCYKLTICKSFRNWLARAHIDSSTKPNSRPICHSRTTFFAAMPVWFSSIQGLCIFSCQCIFAKLLFKKTKKMRKWKDITTVIGWGRKVCH